MRILKTKEILPIDVSELKGDEYKIFKKRSKLHETDIPPFFAYIQDYAWEAFISHGNNVYKSLRHEAQGIFLGKYFKDRHGEFIVATKFAEGNGNSTQSFVEMTEECLAEISKKCQQEELLMLIWVHTHPGFGTFYSGTDINCLKTNFYKTYQIGIVVDIVKKQSMGYKSSDPGIIKFYDYRIFETNNGKIYKPYHGKISETDIKNLKMVNKNRVEIEDIEIELKNIEEAQRKIISKIAKLEKMVITILKNSNRIKKKLNSTLFY